MRVAQASTGLVSINQSLSTLTSAFPAAKDAVDEEQKYLQRLGVEGKPRITLFYRIKRGGPSPITTDWLQFGRPNDLTYESTDSDGKIVNRQSPTLALLRQPQIDGVYTVELGMTPNYGRPIVFLGRQTAALVGHQTVDEAVRSELRILDEQTQPRPHTKERKPKTNTRPTTSTDPAPKASRKTRKAKAGLEDLGTMWEQPPASA